MRQVMVPLSWSKGAPVSVKEEGSLPKSAFFSVYRRRGDTSDLPAKSPEETLYLKV